MRQFDALYVQINFVIAYQLKQTIVVKIQSYIGYDVRFCDHLILNMIRWQIVRQKINNNVGCAKNKKHCFKTRNRIGGRTEWPRCLYALCSDQNSSNFLMQS